MKKFRIAVLFGGCSSEHAVSLQSAHAVLTHLDREAFEPFPVGITREGSWFHYSGPSEKIADGTWTEKQCCTPCVLSPDRTAPAFLLLEARTRAVPVDAAFPVLHGKNGEDGTLQGLLELAGIPLVGCGTLAGALCMDKDRAHKLASLAGVQVPASALFTARDSFASLRIGAEKLGYPLFVKPVRAGSSLGVSRVTEESGLEQAAAGAFLEDDRILLEEAVEGFEVGCAVLGNEELCFGAVDEIALAGGFFDFEEKYTLKTSQIHCPARVSPDTAIRIQQAAALVYRALDCRVFARVDLFLTSKGEILFNEVNTIPGFTPHSRYPGMMRANGLPFPELLRRMIRLGVSK